jgi:hypothetical protein
MHNLISHGVAKIAEFLEGNSPSVVSVSFSSPYLIQHNHTDVFDEVRAVLRDERNTTAFFLFTTQFGAASHELRLFGQAGNLAIDNTYRTAVRITPSRHKSYLRYFLAPLDHAKEHARNSVTNVRHFLRKDFQMDFGMRRLMKLFYGAIREGGPDPIPMDEIRRTARIMDALFEQLPNPGTSHGAR